MLADGRVILQPGARSELQALQAAGASERYSIGGRVFMSHHVRISTPLFDVRLIAPSDEIHFDSHIGYVDTGISQTDTFNSQLRANLPTALGDTPKLIVTELAPLTGFVAVDTNDTDPGVRIDHDWTETQFWGSQVRFEETSMAFTRVALAPPLPQAADTDSVSSTEPATDQTELPAADSDYEAISPGETDGSPDTIEREQINVDLDREARALSSTLCPTTPEDFFLLDSGNVGIQLTIAPAVGAVESYRCILEYPPDEVPNLWVLEPTIPSSYDRAIETDSHGDTRIQYVHNRYAAPMISERQLEYVRKWAIDYSLQRAADDQTDDPSNR